MSIKKRVPARLAGSPKMARRIGNRTADRANRRTRLFPAYFRNRTGSCHSGRLKYSSSLLFFIVLSFVGESF